MLRSHFCFCVLCAVLGLAAAALVLVPPPSPAQAAGAGKGLVSFINDVAPILKENCFACHDAKKRKGKLDMTTYEGLRKGGTKDDPLVPNKPDESLLIGLVTGRDMPRMPPKESGDALPKEKIAVIEQWIKEGAKLDAGLDPKADLLRELRVRWQPPVPPAVYKYPVNITALAFTPDNKKIVAGGYHELTVWDIATGKLEKRLYTRTERPHALVFLPDGKLAVAGGRPGQEGDVKIYNLQAATSKMDNGVAILDGVHDKAVLVASLVETDDEVLCLAASADGKKLAAGGCDRLVRVWNLTGGPAPAKSPSKKGSEAFAFLEGKSSLGVGYQLEQTIENHADWVFGVAFSPDSKHLLTCSRDKTAKVWDLVAKESVLTFPDHQNGVYGVAVKPDGKLGVSVGADNQVRYWNATGDGKQIRASAGHGKEVYKVIYDPKKPLLVTCSADDTVRIWNPDNGAAVRTLSGHTDYVYALALSPDGNLIASGSWNGEVKVWKIADGSLVRAINASPGLPQPPAAPVAAKK
jgi:WD40 repeat protein